MKTSCLWHRPDSHFLIFREQYEQLFGDQCAGAVLSVFEHLTNAKRDLLTAKNCDADPWVIAEMDKIVHYMVGLFKERSIRTRLEYLERIGVLYRDETNRSRYLLNTDLINEKSQKHQVFEAFDGVTGKIADDEVTSKITIPTSKIAVPTGKIAVAYKEEKILEDLKEPSPPIVPPQPEPETPVPADSPDLMLDDPVLTFTQNVYRQHRRAKLEKLQTRAAASLLAELENTERRLGPEAFRAALWRYLDTAGDEYLVRERWPLRYFLKHAERYEDDGAGPRHESPAPRQKQPLAASGRATATATPPPPPAPSCPDLRAEWQQHVPSAPPVAFWPERDLKNFERQWADPVFREQWPALLARCEEFHAAQPGGDDLLSPSWVVKEKNWQRVLGNEFAWKLRKTSEVRHGTRNGEPRPGSLEAVVAEARRLRQEAKLKAKGEPNNASL